MVGKNIDINNPNISIQMLEYTQSGYFTLPCQWKFQDPKMAVLYHIRPYLGGYPLTYSSPYIGLIYGRYLHFRILKFPLTMFGIVLNHQVWFEWDDSLRPMKPCCDGLGHVERRAAQVERGSVWKLLKVCIYINMSTYPYEYNHMYT
jgi:hypothetical protein